jgi:hypothetical protein
MMEGTWGFTSWNDVTSDIVEGQRATFYYMPSAPEPHWAGNAQRMEVKSFRAGWVASARDSSAKVYVEFIPRGALKTRECDQRSKPSLVILEGWQHPDPPSSWMSNGSSVRAKWHLFAPEWRAEMDAFLSAYLRDRPGIRILADFREAPQPPSSEGVPLNVGEESVITTGNSTDNLAPPAAGVDWPTSPDEVHPDGQLIEGAVKSVLVNAYERSVTARRRCIEHYGSACIVCGCDFGEFYGRAVRGYIHVHHLKPLSEIGSDYVVDPINDLRPVCPNCHAVIHSREPPYTVDEVRQFIAFRLGGGQHRG